MRALEGNDAEWLSLHVYPTTPARLDGVVTSLIPAVLLALGDTILQWFFLRYFDTQGLHVRIRLSAKAGDLDLDHVHAVARDQLARAVAGSPREVRVAIYEPEWRKFGGRFCLEHMHELLCLSSRRALEALLAADPSRRTRLRVALSFMMALSHALDISTERYWRFASWYWSGGTAEHAERSRSAIARMAPPSTLFTPSQVEADRAVAYSRAARAILQSVIAAPDAVAGAEHYAFHVIHLMNNRLGVSVIEEACLSHFLVAQAASTGPATLAIDPAEPVGLGAVS